MNRTMMLLCLLSVSLLSWGCAYPVGDEASVIRDATDTPTESDSTMEGLYPGSDENSTGGRAARRTWGQSFQLVTNNNLVRNMQTGPLEETGFSVYTLQFTLNPPQNGGTAAATATIIATVNGVPTNRTISIGQATEISVTADAITVIFQDATPVAANNAGQTYSVGCTICPGVRAGDIAPTLADPAVQFPVSIPANNTVVFNVPQGVGVVGFWLGLSPATNPPTNFGGMFIDEVSSSNSALFKFVAQDVVPTYVPLFPGTTKLTVQNEDNANSCSISILWVIDG